MADVNFWQSLTSRKRIRSLEPRLEEVDPPVTKKSTIKEVIVVDEDDTRAPSQGSGTQGDPIVFGHWVTGNVIAKGVHNGCIVISDGDEADGHGHVRQHEKDIIDLDRDSPEPTQPTSKLERMIPSRDHEDVPEYAPGNSPVMFQTQQPRERRVDSLFQRAEYISFWDDFESASSSRAASSWMAGYDTERVNKSFEPGSTHAGEDKNGDGDDDDCVIIYEEVNKPGNERGPWVFTIKDEENDSSQCELTCSQGTQSTCTVATPSSSQEIPSIANPFSRIFELESHTHHKDLPSTFDAPKHLTETSVCRIWSNGEINVSDEKEHLKNRKRLFWHTHWEHQKYRLERHLQVYLRDVEGQKNVDACWLYKGPKISQTGRALCMKVGFRHNGELKKLSINLALISLLLAGQMTDDHKEGIINEAWHASHLCGNWTCLNPQHINPEPGPINLNRNPCFADRYGPCSHHPPCLKHLKVKLHTLRPPLEMAQLPESHGTEFSSFNARVPQPLGFYETFPKLDDRS